MARVLDDTSKARATTMHNVGRNTSARYDQARSVLIIEVNCADADKAPPSKSGKTRLVGSTSGFTGVDGLDGIRFSLNVAGEID